MVSENDFMYEALNAFEQVYGIDQKRNATSGDALYEINWGGFFPPFGSVRTRKTKITTKDFPKDAKEFFFEFGHPPLNNYIRKMVRAEFITKEQIPEVYAFIKGYDGSTPLDKPPLKVRIKALFSKELRELIGRVDNSYQKGLEAKVEQDLKK